MTMTHDEIKSIHADELQPLDAYVDNNPLKVDLVYAQATHPDNMFKQEIYRPAARMWGHRDFVKIIIRAAHLCYQRSGLLFELKDCLRTVEAQGLMQQTAIVKAHPHWLEEPNRLLSPAGKGGHPRGMAVDIILIDQQGDEIDMGTRFDFLTEDRANNPAARSYTQFKEDAVYNHLILQRRKLLEDSMLQAAEEQAQKILPLPQEWWDFRFMPDYSNRFHPIHDKDLPPEMRMTIL